MLCKVITATYQVIVLGGARNLLMSFEQNTIMRGSRDLQVSFLESGHRRHNYKRITLRSANDYNEVLNLCTVVPGHCTGWKAKAKLAEVFPTNVQQCVVGATYKFSSSERDH